MKYIYYMLFTNEEYVCMHKTLMYMATINYEMKGGIKHNDENVIQK